MRKKKECGCILRLTSVYSGTVKVYELVDSFEYVNATLSRRMEGNGFKFETIWGDYVYLNSSMFDKCLVELEKVETKNK